MASSTSASAGERSASAGRSGHSTFASPFCTHEVFNQAPPLENVNMYSTNVALVEATAREGAGWVSERATSLGRLVGKEPMRWGFEANASSPVLHTHDRYGNRIDEVEFHPAWHRLMRLGVEHELHSLPWRTNEPAAHAARAALYITAMQAEAGFACPITMTFASIPALRCQPELAAQWEPLLSANTYDPRLVRASEKGSAIAGMAMTEKQGGSDVRANTTRAHPSERFGLGTADGGPGGEYELTGHKWFCSAPMSDVFLVLAQSGRHDQQPQLSCFLLPRILPDGTRNAFHIERLKDKLGNRSNASSEIELHGAWAQMVGEPGRGVATIIEMVAHTRLDCALGAAALMRVGVLHATHHAAHRAAFGRLLVEQPLMQNVLADLCLEAEAATALAMRLARAYDEAPPASESASGAGNGIASAGEAELFKRVATAVGKYWVCKRAPNHAFEALECLGGNGYIEDSGMPRLYREAPVLSIWEGTGNVMALDVLRGLARTPAAVEVLLAELNLAHGANRRLDDYVSKLASDLRPSEASASGSDLEARARSLTERMALAIQASLLVRHSPAVLSDAFCAARLDREGGLEYGTLPPGSDFKAIIARSRPPM